MKLLGEVVIYITLVALGVIGTNYLLSNLDGDPHPTPCDQGGPCGNETTF